MEIKASAMTAAGIGSLVGMVLTRPTSITEAVLSLFTGGVTAYYLGEEVAKLIHFNNGAATFLVGALGMAALKILNALVTKMASDPLLFVDRLISTWFNRGGAAKQEA
jgi:hypothetical protein